MLFHHQPTSFSHCTVSLKAILWSWLMGHQKPQVHRYINKLHHGTVQQAQHMHPHLGCTGRIREVGGERVKI